MNSVGWCEEENVSGKRDSGSNNVRKRKLVARWTERSCLEGKEKSDGREKPVVPSLLECYIQEIGSFFPQTEAVSFQTSTWDHFRGLLVLLSAFEDDFARHPFIPFHCRHLPKLQLGSKQVPKRLTSKHMSIGMDLSIPVK